MNDKKSGILLDDSLMGLLKVIAKVFKTDVTDLITRALNNFIIDYLNDELNK